MDMFGPMSRGLDDFDNATCLHGFNSVVCLPSNMLLVNERSIK